MKNNKLYLIIAIVTLICFLGTAALCNQAGGEGEIPTIKLEIYEGPTYSEEEGVCYYKIGAVVTGSPEPEIEFEQNYNIYQITSSEDLQKEFELYGLGATVRLEDEGDSCILTAIATNSEGSVTASMNLTWGCEEEVSNEDLEETGEEEDILGEEQIDQESEKRGDEEKREEEEAIQGDPEPPGISIFIYEGPTFSASDGVCYYRIEAKATGNPAPVIEFSKDDSDGAWGPKRCQVNLEDSDETYTLRVTARNSSGEAEDSLVLTWGCMKKIEKDELIGKDLEIIQSIVLQPTNIGYAIRYGGIDYSTCLIGDSDMNMDIRGFFDFDLSSLIGKEIISATLELENPVIHGDPAFKGSCVKILNLYNYSQLDSYDLGDGVILDEDCSGNDEIILSQYLDGIIRDTIDPRSSGIMLKFKLYYVNATTDGDYAIDGREYTRSNISLTVRYKD